MRWGGRECGSEWRERVEREGEVVQKCLLCRCPAVVLLKVVQPSFHQELSSRRCPVVVFFESCPVVVDSNLITVRY